MNINEFITLYESSNEETRLMIAEILEEAQSQNEPLELHSDISHKDQPLLKYQMCL